MILLFSIFFCITNLIHANSQKTDSGLTPYRDFLIPGTSTHIRLLQDSRITDQYRKKYWGHGKHEASSRAEVNNDARKETWLILSASGYEQRGWITIRYIPGQKPTTADIQW